MWRVLCSSKWRLQKIQLQKLLLGSSCLRVLVFLPVWSYFLLFCCCGCGCAWSWHRCPEWIWMSSSSTTRMGGVRRVERRTAGIGTVEAPKPGQKTEKKKSQGVHNHFTKKLEEIGAAIRGTYLVPRSRRARGGGRRRRRGGEFGGDRDSSLAGGR